MLETDHLPMGGGQAFDSETECLESARCLNRHDTVRIMALLCPSTQPIRTTFAARRTTRPLLGCAPGREELVLRKMRGVGGGDDGGGRMLRRTRGATR